MGKLSGFIPSTIFFCWIYQIQCLFVLWLFFVLFFFPFAVLGSMRRREIIPPLMINVKLQ